MSRRLPAITLRRAVGPVPDQFSMPGTGAKIFVMVQPKPEIRVPIAQPLFVG